MNFTLLALFCIAFGVVNAGRMPFKGCKGRATYRVSFRNFLTPDRFDALPETGLMFSPMSGVSHSNRVSLFTVRGFANNETALIAKTGNNAPFLALAESIRDETSLVRSVEGAAGPTLPGSSSAVTLIVDCKRPFITAIAMIAPSPDWIVQISNMNLYDRQNRSFVTRVAGNLRAYDAGVDSGSDFTDPADPSLDIPTVPQENIAPLVEDDTDRFMGRLVGRYIVRRMD